MYQDFLPFFKAKFRCIYVLYKGFKPLTGFKGLQHLNVANAWKHLQTHGNDLGDTGEATGVGN